MKGQINEEEDPYHPDNASCPHVETPDNKEEEKDQVVSEGGQ